MGKDGLLFPSYICREAMGLFGSFFLKLFSILKNKEKKKNRKTRLVRSRFLFLKI